MELPSTLPTSNPMSDINFDHAETLNESVFVDEAKPKVLAPKIRLELLQATEHELEASYADKLTTSFTFDSLMESPHQDHSTDDGLYEIGLVDSDEEEFLSWAMSRRP